MCRRGNIESRGPLGSAFDIVADGERAAATLPLLGEHNIYNALAAVAVGLQYGVPLRDGRRIAGHVISR